MAVVTAMVLRGYFTGKEGGWWLLIGVRNGMDGGGRCLQGPGEYGAMMDFVDMENKGNNNGGIWN
jgi:hypothetical protein